MLQDHPERMAEIAKPYATTSDKIRALSAAGCSRAEIAKFLNKRYQHVRNVLVGGAPKGSPFASGHEEPSGMSEGPTAPYALDSGSAVLRLLISESGTVQLPAVALQALGLKAGGVVIAELDENHLALLSVEESVRRVQDMVRALVPGNHSLADSLVADRRREVERELG